MRFAGRDSGLPLPPLRSPYLHRLRVLLSVAKSLNEGGGELHVAGPAERVRDVLATSGYDALFPVHATLGAARSHFGA